MSDCKRCLHKEICPISSDKKPLCFNCIKFDDASNYIRKDKLIEMIVNIPSAINYHYVVSNPLQSYLTGKSQRQFEIIELIEKFELFGG